MLVHLGISIRDLFEVSLDLIISIAVTNHQHLFVVEFSKLEVPSQVLVTNSVRVT